jgi:hypothetical protein
MLAADGVVEGIAPVGNVREAYQGIVEQLELGAALRAVGLGVSKLPEAVVRRCPELDAAIVLGEREGEQSPERELVIERETAGRCHGDVREAALGGRSAKEPRAVHEPAA